MATQDLRVTILRITMNNKKSPRGGARKGAGRKKLYSEPLVSLNIKLPASVRSEVMKQGGSTWARQILIQALTKE